MDEDQDFKFFTRFLWNSELVVVIILKFNIRDIQVDASFIIFVFKRLLFLKLLNDLIKVNKKVILINTYMTLI